MMMIIEDKRQHCQALKAWSDYYYYNDESLVFVSYMPYAC